jgi:phage terminase large subunit-like protein
LSLALSWLTAVDKIRAICRRYQVRELACDVFHWARTFQVLDDEGLPVMEFPQTPARMTPASTRFSDAVVNRTLTHDGDPQLARHVGNAVIREDSRGARLAKEHRHSRRRIDACVAAVTAVHRAAELAGASEPSIYL